MDVFSIFIWMMIIQETTVFICAISPQYPSPPSNKLFSSRYPSSHTNHASRSNSLQSSRHPPRPKTQEFKMSSHTRISLPFTQTIPVVITRLSSVPSRLTGSPKSPTPVTPLTPGVVTSKVVTGPSDTRILKKGFKRIEGLLLMIIVLVAAIAGSLTTWFLMKLRRSHNNRSSKGYEALAVGHI